MKATTTDGIGHTAASLRVARGLSMTALARAAHLDRRTLATIEKGSQTVTTARLAAVARVLRVSLAEYVAACERARVGRRAS